jgi:N6-L-threonylcarbamoyladenine synthase
VSRDITVLGLESSCDETAAAVVRLQLDAQGHLAAPGQILSNCVLSQIDLHAPYGGVVPEIAARAHISHMDRLVGQALEESGLALQDMDAIAATAGPGLIGGVLIGLTTGKALALAADKPFIGINHLEGHALTARLSDAVAFPYLLLLVSGGHCQLLSVYGLGHYEVLGGTIDDAVGEAFDKGAKLMSLGYPGGPQIEAHALHGDPHAFVLPRPLLDRADMPFDFSFSGLKTALRRQADKVAPLSDTHIADLSASFQAAIIACLCDRTGHAMRHFAGQKSDQALTLVVAGGVAANQALRKALGETAANHGFELRVPPPALCTDNAAMIAWAGAEHVTSAEYMASAEHERARVTGLAHKARARWPLSEL